MHPSLLKILEQCSSLKTPKILIAGTQESTFSKTLFNQTQWKYNSVKGIHRFYGPQHILGVGEVLYPSISNNIESLSKESINIINSKGNFRYLLMTPIADVDMIRIGTDVLMIEPQWFSDTLNELKKDYPDSEIKFLQLTDEDTYLLEIGSSVLAKKVNKLAIPAEVGLSLQEIKSGIETFREQNSLWIASSKLGIAIYIEDSSIPFSKGVENLLKKNKKALFILAMLLLLPLAAYAIIVSLHYREQKDDFLSKEVFLTGSEREAFKEVNFVIRSSLCELIGLMDNLCDTEVNKEQQEIISKAFNCIDEVLNDSSYMQEQISKDSNNKTVVKKEPVSDKNIKRLLETLKLRADSLGIDFNAESKISSEALLGPWSALRYAVIHQCTLIFQTLSSLRDPSVSFVIREIDKFSNKAFIEAEIFMSNVSSPTYLKRNKKRIENLQNVLNEYQGAVEFKAYSSDKYSIRISIPFAHDSSKKADKSNIKPNTQEEKPHLKKTSNSTILVVDDNQINRTVMSALLEKRGYQVMLAVDGTEAIDLLSKPNDVELVFMDLEMPNMSGIETTKEIREGKSVSVNKDIPIVALTAHAKAAFEANCLEVGMNDYITKPFLPSAIEQVIQKWGS